MHCMIRIEKQALKAKIKNRSFGQKLIGETAKVRKVIKLR